MRWIEAINSNKLSDATGQQNTERFQQLWHLYNLSWWYLAAMWQGLMGREGRGRSSFGDLAEQFATQTVRQRCTRRSHRTYKALCSIIHVAQLEAVLVLKGLRQGVTQVVRGQGSLPAVLELGENALKTRTTTCFQMSYRTFCFVSQTQQRCDYYCWLHPTFNAQKMQESPKQTCPGSCLKLRLKMSSCHST